MADRADQGPKEVVSVGLKGFSNSKHYEDVRPAFPRDVVELLMKKVGALNQDGSAGKRSLKILELGAGTGKFTRIMLDVLQGTETHVVASDPVPAMCEQFRRVLPQVEILQFGAENIDFPDESFDAVLAAGCLHWFCSEQSFNEIYRVLRPKGVFGITWVIFAHDYGKDSGWLIDILEYLDPFYRQNSIIWPSLHYKDIIEHIPREKFTEPEFIEPEVYFPIPSNFNKAFKYFCSLSVVAVFTDEKRALFRQFYEKVLDKYFRKEGRELKSLVFKSPVVWCQKLN